MYKYKLSNCLFPQKLKHSTPKYHKHILVNLKLNMYKNVDSLSDFMTIKVFYMISIIRISFRQKDISLLLVDVL